MLTFSFSHLFQQEQHIVLSSRLSHTNMLPSVAFTIISILSSSLALIVTFLSIIIFLIHLRHTRDVVILHLTNTYITIFLFSVVAMNIFIKVLRADLYGFDGLSDVELERCRMEGFLMFVSFGLCYLSFVLQAVYRLLRVIHPRHKLFQVCHFLLLLRFPTPLEG